MAPEEAHARRAAELVGAADQEVGAQVFDVDRQVRKALAGIHQHQGASGMGQVGHRTDRVEAAQGVADLHQAHQPGALVDLAAQVLEIQFTAACQAGVAQDAAGAVRQQLPGHEVAVVLHHRQQHLIAGAEVRFPPAAGHQVDGLTRIAGEDDFVRGRGAHKGGGFGPRTLKALGGPGAQLMGAAMDVGVVVVVVVLQRLEHLAGLLAGGGVIEVDQGLAQAGLLRQQREVLAGLGRQIHRGNAHQAGGAAHADSSSN